MSKANSNITQKNRIAALEQRIRAEALAKNHLLAALALRYGAAGVLEVTDKDFEAVTMDATLKIAAGPEGVGGVVITAGKQEAKDNTAAEAPTLPGGGS